MNAKGNPDGFLSHFSSLRNFRLGRFFDSLRFSCPRKWEQENRFEQDSALTLIVGDALSLRGSGLLGREGQNDEGDEVGQHVVNNAGHVELEQEVKAGVDIAQSAEEAEQDRSQCDLHRTPAAEDHDGEGQEAEARDAVFKLPDTDAGRDESDAAEAAEPWPLAKETLGLLQQNLCVAKEKDLPICQDTGMACVFVELGTDVHIDGSFEAAIHEGVRRGYTDGYLRKSIVADPLRRGNTGDNTPAAITVHLVDGEGCRITVAPKGFGSENMSRIQMLKPADGVEGFKKFVVDTVKLAGSNPCPPIVLGIGVGGSFDKVAYLAKKALLRPLDVPNPDPYYAGLERELLTAINELGIGPQGFGGQTTCLGLAIEQMPTHVAGLPVAVNVSCHVTRRASARL